MTMQRWFFLPLFICITVGLSYTILSLPQADPTLQRQVAQNLEASGVSNPVTAVLLNFRAYDTLLELTVLLLAVIGVASLRGRPLRAGFTPGPVLETFTFLLMPLIILVAGYLLWAGAHAPGGAFQAGAVLSTITVLLLLSGWQPPIENTQLRARLALGCGIFAFAVVAMFNLWRGDALLQYPVAHAGALIFFIESAATLAIAATLSLVFIGSAPGAETKSL